VPDPRSSRTTAGLTAGIAAYALWGVFPLYFPLLEPARPVEIIAHRVVWSLLFCLVTLAVTRSWRQFAELWRKPRTLLLLGIAAVFLAVNWTVYVYGVNSGHVVDASLGYFVNPLVTVLLAVVFLHERLRAVQWAALGLGTAAVLVIALGQGTVPWIALVLASSFGLYGLIKSRVGGHVEAAPGLAAETALLAPLAGGYWVWLELHGTSTFGAYGGWHAAALASAGVVTAVPLLMFSAAARRLPLSLVGLIQYLTPVLQFAIGVAVQHEAMSTARWAGFGLVWAALVVLVVDGARHRRVQVHAARAAAEVAGA
jgi:chloramphenicol-sensitive protein RarD